MKKLLEIYKAARVPNWTVWPKMMFHLIAIPPVCAFIAINWAFYRSSMRNFFSDFWRYWHRMVRIILTSHTFWSEAGIYKIPWGEHGSFTLEWRWTNPEKFRRLTLLEIENH